MRVIDGEEVRRRLTYARCIPLVREAMIAFSAGHTRQRLRSIIPLANGHTLGVMPGALGEAEMFGAKLVSVYPENFRKGAPSHQGVVVLFDPVSGAPVCVADAGAITAIRTAAASAVATDALARPDATRLAILGYGEQAAAHLHALRHVRPIEAVAVWGRDPDRTIAFAARMHDELELLVVPAADARTAVRNADIVCTVTNAADPILRGEWLSDGAHVNLIGSSIAARAEVDDDLVARCRFIADSREGVMMQGGEFRRAKASGRITDAHIAGEIGEVLSNKVEGRRSATQCTAYKSLGHVVQDLAAAKALIEAD